MKAEKDLLPGRGGGGDGGIEGIDYGCDQFEVTDDGSGEARIEGSVGRKGGAESPLAVLDEIEGGVVLGESLGRAGEGVALELGKHLADGRTLGEFAELDVVVEQPVADGGQLVFLGHVGPGGDHHLFGADVEVVSGA